MIKETLAKANSLVDRLEECKKNLERIRYTQNQNVAIRESDLSYNGIEGSVTVPKSLFRVVGKLIESEYIQEIDKLQKELEDL